MTIKISNAEVQELLANNTFEYPKYSIQIMNLANQNAQGTRPNVVGQMSDLIQEFGNGSMADWDAWYKERYPNSIEAATDRVYRMIELLKKVFKQLTGIL